MRGGREGEAPSGLGWRGWKGKGASAAGGERKPRGLEWGGRTLLRQEAILPQEMKEGRGASKGDRKLSRDGGGDSEQCRAPELKRHEIGRVEQKEVI